MRLFVIGLAGGAIMLCAGVAAAQEQLTVTPTKISDEKAVFATVESPNTIPARARIGGTIVTLAVKDGDSVAQGQVIARIVDEKLQLQSKSLDAQIAGLESQLAQAEADLVRTEGLLARGVATRTRTDELRTAATVASNALKARKAERAVLEQQMTEGAVLAPTAGRVLKVPVTVGTVVLAGEAVATIAEGNFILRLRVPERHAQFLKVGDSVRLDGAELGLSAPRFGKIRLVYPEIADGRVKVDAVVDGLNDYFVGERIRVWVSAGERQAFVIPAAFLITRFGIDYAKLRTPDGKTIDVPVQRGVELPRPAMLDGVEILSGLKSGDVVVKP
ncbi:MAG: efflux RND transporter periplasmic adaptor subunit [Alphaproteobacteria bacterium]